MASYRIADKRAFKSEGGDRGAPQSESDTADEQERIARLPGVVNDLPEVAPHEWIYLMS